MENKREALKNKKRIVIKVGTSSLTFLNGRLNFHRIEKLAFVISTLRNKGFEVLLVSSGAIGVGAGRIGMDSKPKKLAQKQALAAIGQAELMKIYQKFFEEYNQIVAQVLLTKEVINSKQRYINAKTTLDNLLNMRIVPIINENDTISTFEIEFGDNDTLSAIVAELISADVLIMLSDIEGLYSTDPKKDNNGHLIHFVEEITPEIEKIASGTGTSFSTGGMVTKISAAKIATFAGIDTVIIDGRFPENIIKVLEGEKIGTHFLAKKNKVINFINN